MSGSEVGVELMHVDIYMCRRAYANSSLRHLVGLDQGVAATTCQVSYVGDEVV